MQYNMHVDTKYHENTSWLHTNLKSEGAVYMLSAITNRRSIRRYQNQPVPKHLIEKIIQAGMLAPSSKNRQPWFFIVTAGPAKNDMLLAMRNGLLREKEHPFLAESTQHQSGALRTLQIMEQAPVVILVVNSLGIDIRHPLHSEDRIYEICNAQSIGAAMENMTLTASDLGLGSLWICDTYFAYDELQQWLNLRGELTAAMALGYANESPAARPRKNMDEIVEWRIK